MSSSRSVAAAQKRRAGPPDPPQPHRGPQTSISSSQAFQPVRPGTSGRLAGQHASLQQQQMQQAKQEQNTATSSSKMSVPQAITLITLRLGRLESQLQNLDLQNLAQNESGDTNPILETILERLSLLEQKSLENAALKQQMEIFKPALVSLKNMSSKDSKEMKVSIDSMRNEIELTKAMVQDLRSFVTNDGMEDIGDDVNAHVNDDLKEEVRDEVKEYIQNEVQEVKKDDSITVAESA